MCLYNIIYIAIQYDVSFNAVFTGVMEIPIYIYTKDLAMFSSEEKVGSMDNYLVNLSRVLRMLFLPIHCCYSNVLDYVILCDA